jgi:hypothetical protein
MRGKAGYEMRKLHIVGLALFAVFAFSAVAVESASAARGGPQWIVVLCEKVPVNTGHWLKLNSSTLKCEERDAVAEGEWETKLMTLATGEVEPIRSTGGVFVLNGTLASVECKTEDDTGELIGGTPGADFTKIEFLTCNVVGKPNCLAGSTAEPENILAEAQTVLVYPKEKAGLTAEALDAFFPPNKGETENLFVEFTLKNATGSTECALLNTVKVNVEAIGTLVLEPTVIKKCGVLGRVGKLSSSNVFSRTESGEQGVVGALEFPTVEPIPLEAEEWETVKENYNKITCKLEALGGEAKELGTTDVELTNTEEFGWEV